MFSMDFEEFLWAKGYGENTAADMLSHMKMLQPFNELEMKVYHPLFMDYNILDGMPAVVAEYIQKNTFEGSLDTQKQLIADYKEDIRKYASGMGDRGLSGRSPLLLPSVGACGSFFPDRCCRFLPDDHTACRTGSNGCTARDGFPEDRSCASGHSGRSESYRHRTGSDSGGNSRCTGFMCFFLK